MGCFLFERIDMKEIKLTQNKIALIDSSDFEYFNQFKWSAVKINSTFYAKRSIRLANGKQTAIYMHREILNVPKGMETDHVDHRGLNNQRANIRICTRQENQMNRNSNRDSTSIFKGVSWEKDRRKWQTQIKYKGKSKHLGRFFSETEAALAYDKKAKELFGEFARLNKIIK